MGKVFRMGVLLLMLVALAACGSSGGGSSGSKSGGGATASGSTDPKTNTGDSGTKTSGGGSGGDSGTTTPPPPAPIPPPPVTQVTIAGDAAFTAYVSGDMVVALRDTGAATYTVMQQVAGASSTNFSFVADANLGSKEVLVFNDLNGDSLLDANEGYGVSAVTIADVDLTSVAVTVNAPPVTQITLSGSAYYGAYSSGTMIVALRDVGAATFTVMQQLTGAASVSFSFIADANLGNKEVLVFNDLNGDSLLDANEGYGVSAVTIADVDLTSVAVTVNAPPVTQITLSGSASYGAYSSGTMIIALRDVGAGTFTVMQQVTGAASVNFSFIADANLGNKEVLVFNDLNGDSLLDANEGYGVSAVTIADVDLTSIAVTVNAPPVTQINISGSASYPYFVSGELVVALRDVGSATFSVMQQFSGMAAIDFGYIAAANLGNKEVLVFNDVNANSALDVNEASAVTAVTIADMDISGLILNLTSPIDPAPLTLDINAPTLANAVDVDVMVFKADSTLVAARMNQALDGSGVASIVVHNATSDASQIIEDDLTVAALPVGSYTVLVRVDALRDGIIVGGVDDSAYLGQVNISGATSLALGDSDFVALIAHPVTISNEAGIASYKVTCMHHLPGGDYVNDVVQRSYFGVSSVTLDATGTGSTATTTYPAVPGTLDISCLAEPAPGNFNMVTGAGVDKVIDATVTVNSVLIDGAGTAVSGFTATVATADGSIDAPVVLSGMLPYNGQVDTSDSYYRIFGVNAGDSVVLTLSNLSDDLDLYVYDDAAYTNLVCSAVTAGVVNESCTAIANASGELFIRVSGVNSAAGSGFYLDATVGEGSSALPKDVTYQANYVGRVGMGVDSYYQVTGLVANSTYPVRLTTMSDDVDLYVYGDAAYGSLSCSSVQVGTVDEFCQATSNSAGELYIRVNAAQSAAGATFTIGYFVDEGIKSSPITVSVGSPLGGQVAIGGVSFYKSSGTMGNQTYTVSLTGLVGDVDLYIYSNSGYTLSKRICSSVNSGLSDESCSVKASGSGNLYIQVVDYNSRVGSSYTLSIQ